MDERVRYRNLLLGLWGDYALSYRERFKDFERLRIVDEAKRLRDLERGILRPKRVITKELWSYYYEFSGIGLLNKETRVEALDYLDSLGCDDLKALEYELRRRLKEDNHDYRSFVTLLGQKHDAYLNPKKSKLGYDPSSAMLALKTSYKTVRK